VDLEGERLRLGGKRGHGRIAAITNFVDTSVLPHFGLRRTLRD
jgi:hypothetical protein